MTTARLPDDEAARHKTLTDLCILDTLPEGFSDAVTVAAAAIAQVPIAAVSLVDTHRQWFKASCGLGVTQTPRGASFCAHAILQATPLVVADTHLDPRFIDNPLVTGTPFVRAYAGVPLRVHGRSVGALCVLDDRPRAFDGGTIQQLVKLAAGTAAWLAERQRFDSILERERGKLRYVTFYDTLTGLPSRMLLQDRVLQSAARCDRTRRSLAVLFIRVVDRRVAGQLSTLIIGDSAVCEVAERLKKLVRASDTVARIEGCDFVILAEGEGRESALRVANEVRSALALPLANAGRDARLDVAVGAAIYPADGPGDRLVGRAALASSQPPDNEPCAFFGPKISDDVQAREEMIAGQPVASSPSPLPGAPWAEPH